MMLSFFTKLDTINPRLFQWGLYLLAVLIHLIYLSVFQLWDIPLRGDAPQYHSIAVSFLNGDGWKIPQSMLQSYRTPLVSLLLFGIYAVFGVNVMIARLVIALLVATTSVILFSWLTKGMRQSQTVALVIALIWSFYPPKIFYVSFLTSENLAGFFMIALFAMLYWHSQKQSWQTAVGCGFLFGLLALNRGVYGPLPIYLLICHFLWMRFGKNPPLIRHWLIILMAYIVTLTPWTVRNYLIHDTFMPFTSSFGIVLFITHSDLSDPLIQEGAYLKEYKTAFAEKLAQAKTEVEWMNLQTAEAMQRIKAKIEFLPTAVLNRGLNFWSIRPDPFDPNWTRNDTIMTIVLVPVFGLFLLSFWLLSFRKYWLLYAVIFYAFLFVLPFWGAPRFRYPVDPLIIALAGITAFEWLRKLGFQYPSTPTQ